MESVALDINELDKSLDLTRKECAFRGTDSPAVLTQFMSVAEGRCEELKRNAKIAQVNLHYSRWILFPTVSFLMFIIFKEAFKNCVEFYGESPKTLTNSFFSILLNFSKHFQVDFQTLENSSN